MTFKMPFLKQFDAKTSIEQGRSMVEILAVLAVIGVLSMAGISGYIFAMNKYRANDIVHEVNKRVQDIWYKYQNRPLPTSFDDWANVTPSGFPITVRSSLNGLTFSVDVDEVPNGVCQSVLNMRLDKILAQLIRIVPIHFDTESDEGVVFTNSSLICKTYGEKSGIRFLASLGNLNGIVGTGKPIDKNGEPTDYCYATSDCKFVNNRTCYQCVNNLCQPDCGVFSPFCQMENTTEPVCVKCIKNEHCAKGYICNEMSNTCQKVTETCQENEFRTYNGGCVPCTSMSNIRIKSTPFEYKQGDEIVFADSKSGKEICEEQCADEQKFVVETVAKDGEESKMFCASTCVDGHSYSSNKGCIECQKGSFTMLPDGLDKPKEQCQACGGIWVEDIRGSRNTVCVNDTCDVGKEFLGFNSSSEIISCRACNHDDARDSAGRRTRGTYYSYTLAPGTASDLSIFETVQKYCEACNRKFVVTKTYGICYPKFKPGEEFVSKGGYGVLCSDPEPLALDKNHPEAEELCLACGRTVKNDTCIPVCKETQEWTNLTDMCFTCDNLEANTRLDNKGVVDENAKSLCLKCNREIVEKDGQTHCLVKQKTAECETGHFVNIAGECQPCDTNQTNENIAIRNAEDCTNACTGENGITKRYVSTVYENDKTDTYCVKACESTGQYGVGNGQCYDCTDKESNVVIGNSLINEQQCEACENRHISRKGTEYALCEWKSCEEGYVLNDLGQCILCAKSTFRLWNEQYSNKDNLANHQQSCLTCGVYYDTKCYPCAGSAYNIDIKDETEIQKCLSCPNRMIIGKSCLPFELGKTGVCNSYGNGYVNGYDAGNGVLFRSTSSTKYPCESCLTEKPIKVGDDDIGREQCNSCGETRQLVDGYCVLGGCLSGETFKTLNDGCQSCLFGFGKYEIDINDAAECDTECGTNKFVQQIGTGDAARYYCVNQPHDEKHFIAADGSEVYFETLGDVAIGVDSSSEQFCISVGRLANNGVCSVKNF